jgi:hypothetical protein
MEDQLKHAPTGQLSEPIRLITPWLDPKQYPMEALIGLYHPRIAQ